MVVNGLTGLSPVYNTSTSRAPNKGRSTGVKCKSGVKMTCSIPAGTCHCFNIVTTLILQKNIETMCADMYLTPVFIKTLTEMFNIKRPGKYRKPLCQSL